MTSECIERISLCALYAICITLPVCETLGEVEQEDVVASRKCRDCGNLMAVTDEYCRVCGRIQQPRPGGDSQPQFDVSWAKMAVLVGGTLAVLVVVVVLLVLLD